MYELPLTKLGSHTKDYLSQECPVEDLVIRRTANRRNLNYKGNQVSRLRSPYPNVPCLVPVKT